MEENQLKIPEKVYESFEYWDLRSRIKQAWSEGYLDNNKKIQDDDGINLTPDSLREIHEFVFNTKLENDASTEETLYNLVPMSNMNECLAHIDRARLHWENSVAEEVYALSKEAKTPLVRKLKTPLTPEEIKSDLEDCRFLYDR